MHMAEDSKGDFVVVWAQNDHVTDANGNTITDSNIYAEYLTNEVQRITLPAQSAAEYRQQIQHVRNRFDHVWRRYGADAGDHPHDRVEFRHPTRPAGKRG